MCMSKCVASVRKVGVCGEVKGVVWAKVQGEGELGWWLLGVCLCGVRGRCVGR